MNSKLERVFVYGTLRDKTTREQVIGRDSTSVSGQLPHHRHTRIHIDGKVYPAIEPSENSLVGGEVIMVTADELARIDAYEGNRYCREIRQLADGTAVFVYMKKKKTRNGEN
jgi:gamma-glutamylcyclotransferase (GGCT)/AIG2-like uncharacterized protein YtfP